jgi:hypothetical protein
MTGGAWGGGTKRQMNEGEEARELLAGQGPWQMNEGARGTSSWSRTMADE